MNIRVIALLAMTLLFSCEEVEEVEFGFDETTDRLISQKLGEVSLFYQASVKAGLEGRYSGSELYTYFAPNDKAMLAALNAGGYSNVNEAPVDFLTDLVNNHTVEGLVMADSVSKGSFTAVSGETLYTSTNDGGVYLNANSAIVSADNRSTNGVIHVLGYPIIEFPSTTIAGIVSSEATSAEPEFTTLLAALEYVGLTSTFASTNNQYTVFAPTDAAFAGIGVDASTVTNLPVEAVTQLLSYHVLAGRYFSMDLSSGRYFTLQGDAESGEQGIDLSVSNSEISIDGRLAASATGESLNLLATNGTIHIVNNIVLPRPYVSDAITFNTFLLNPDLAPLLGDATEASLAGNFASVIANANYNVDSLFRSENEVSVLMPFVIDASSSATDVLLSHTFTGTLDLSAEEGNKISSLNGNQYYVTEGFDGSTYVNGRSRISEVQDFFAFPGDDRSLIEDYSTYNGLLSHVVFEFVPLPVDSVTASDVLMANYPDRTLFAAVLDFLELNNLPDHTYLAPSDAALQAVVDELDITFNGEGELIVEDVAALEEIINAHIVTSVFFDIDYNSGDTYTDRNGDDISIVFIPDSGGFGIQVNDGGTITVVPINPDGGDLLYNQGVVHSLGGLIYVL